MAPSAWRRRPISARPSHVSRPHRGLHLRSQCRSPHGGYSTDGPNGCCRARPPHLLRQTPRTLRGPINNSTDGPSCCRRTPPPHNAWHAPHAPRGPMLQGVPPNALRAKTVITTASDLGLSPG
eukprot:9225145-Pyramimonas_sp.AAC.1